MTSPENGGFWKGVFPERTPLTPEERVEADDCLREIEGQITSLPPEQQAKLKTFWENLGKEN